MNPPCHGRARDFVFDTDGNRTSPARIEAAVALCATCAQRVACLEAELDVMRRGVTTLGVYGGTTQAERRRMVDPHTPDPDCCGHDATDADYHRHRKADETACPESMRAHRQYEQDRPDASRSIQMSTDRRRCKRMMARLRREALAESWSLRDELRTEAA